MRILHTVEKYYPSAGGMQEAVRQISKHLAENGHDLTVATGWMKERRDSIFEGVRIRQFKVHGNYTAGFRGEVGAYREFILSENLILL
jgi:hypothetical protein